MKRKRSRGRVTCLATVVTLVTAISLLVSRPIFGDEVVGSGGFSAIQQRNRNHARPSPMQEWLTFQQARAAMERRSRLRQYLPTVERVMGRLGRRRATCYLTRYVPLKETNTRVGTERADIVRDCGLRIHDEVVRWARLDPKASLHHYKGTQLVFSWAAFAQSAPNVLSKVAADHAERFAEELKRELKTSEESFWENGRGRFGDPARYFTHGVSDLSPDVADWLARMVGDSSTQNMVSGPVGLRALVTLLHGAEEVRRSLVEQIIAADPRGAQSSMLRPAGGALTLSQRAIRVLTKTKVEGSVPGTRPTDAQYFHGLRVAVKERLGVDLQPAVLKAAREYLNLVDVFVPHHYAEPQDPIDLDRAQHGVLAVDFKDCNGDNRAETAAVLTRLRVAAMQGGVITGAAQGIRRRGAGSLLDAIIRWPVGRRSGERKLTPSVISEMERLLDRVAIATRKGNDRVTRRMNSRRRAVDEAIRRVVPETERYFMGDDGFGIPQRELMPSEIEALVASVANAGAGGCRATWVPPDIPTGFDRQRPVGSSGAEVADGFGAEKELDGLLGPRLSEEQREKLTFAVIRSRRAFGRDALSLLVGGPGAARAPMDEIAKHWSAIAWPWGCDVAEVRVMTGAAGD
jgi:hypothetical protein